MVIHILDLFGTAVFALTGALVAGRKRMDVFGVVVVALVTAVGGGTVRDLVLGRPVFWVADVVYVIVATATALATFMTVRLVSSVAGRLRWALLGADALGLAVFTVIGAEKATAAGVHALVVVIMGVMTGVAGGIVRDVLCGEIPLVLRKEIYATASLAEALSYRALERAGASPAVAVAAGAATVLAIRLAAIRWGLSLPVFHVGETEGAETNGPGGS